MEQQSEQNSLQDRVRVGDSLRGAREAAGLSLNEVADRLKLSLRQLEAIERDDFDALPGSTFVRGFVRNYARFLEIDPAPLMDALEAHFPSAAHEVANLSRDGSGGAVSEAEDAGSGKWLVVGLVGVVLGAAAVWIFGHRHETTPDIAPMVSQQTASEMAMAASAPSMMSSAPVAHAASAAMVVHVASAPVAKPKEASAAAKAKSVVPASAPVASAQGRVSISVAEPSWVSVTDATGKRLVYSMVQPGAAREVSGVAPFKVRVGNADKVTLGFNGQNVDLAPHTQGSTANLELK